MDWNKKKNATPPLSFSDENMGERNNIFIFSRRCTLMKNNESDPDFINFHRPMANFILWKNTELCFACKCSYTAPNKTFNISLQYWYIVTSRGEGLTIIQLLINILIVNKYNMLFYISLTVYVTQSNCFISFLIL